MDCKFNKKIGKGFAAAILLALIISLSISPLFTEKASAQFAAEVFDHITEFNTGVTAAAAVANSAATVTDVAHRTIKTYLDIAATFVARVAIQMVVNSTVQWAQSGFDGNPAYAVNPKQYFTDMGDGIAGSFIGSASSSLSFLCSPFQAQVRLALRSAYLQPTYFQCTLSGIVGNLQNYYQDFSQGGWEAWFSMTQNPSNNAYGALIEAQTHLDTQIATEKGLKTAELNWGQGFLSFKKCSGYEQQDGQGGATCINRDTGKEMPYTTQTPGAIIKQQVDNSLGASIGSLMTTSEFDQLINAFAQGLLKRYVFGGLFKRGSPVPVTPPQGSSYLNTLNTGKPGTPLPADTFDSTSSFDSDGDGVPDTCLLGGNYPDCVSNNPNTLPPTTTPPATTTPSGSPFPISGVCATREEIDRFLTENPGDAGRLASAFPCTTPAQ